MPNNIKPIRCYCFSFTQSLLLVLQAKFCKGGKNICYKVGHAFDCRLFDCEK